MFVPIKIILQKKFGQNLRLRSGLEKIQVKELWKEISLKVLKKKTAALLKPLSFNRNVLIVSACHHFAAQEAKLKEEEIKKEINSCFGREILKKVVYKYNSKQNLAGVKGRLDSQK